VISSGGLQLYMAALGNCFEIDDWGPIEFSIMAKHFDRQGKPPYAAVSFLILANMNYETAMLLCIDSFSRIICNFYIDSYFFFQQYMSHLLSHGQLDGSG
jgi:hypothetical protein